jgi:hypothetical protein
MPVRGHHDLERDDAAAADLRQQRLTDDALEHERELRANLALLVRRKISMMRLIVCDAELVCSVPNVKWPVSAMRSAGFHRLEVAHLTDEDDVRVLAAVPRAARC